MTHLTETFWHYAIRRHARRPDHLGDFVRLVSKGQIACPREPSSLADLRYIFARERIDVPAATCRLAWTNFRSQTRPSSQD
jgi:hypothetical protein